MTTSAKAGGTDDASDGRALIGIGRGFGGALIFALPMLMTMEMWELGFYMDPGRLLLLLLLVIPLLAVLSRHVGFERTLRWREDFRDAAIAFGLGIAASAVILAVFGVITSETPLREVVGKVAIQSVPASIGALLGRSQLGGHRPDGTDDIEADSYASELFLMGIGALFLGLNVAPTEEMVLISYKMTPWHALALVALSLAVMHGFVYALEFHGGEGPRPEGVPWWSPFLRFTAPGYVLSLLISLYVLWTFGRVDDLGATQIVMVTVVLGFPAAVGAASARLVL